MAEMSVSTENSRSTPSLGDDAWRWVKALGAAADAAADNPARCVALASAVRSVRDGLVAQELRDDAKDDHFLILAETLIGENRSLEIGDRRSPDRKPPEVA